MPKMSDCKSICFSIPTYKREVELKRLLLSIQASIAASSITSQYFIRIRDNDSESSNSLSVLQSYCPSANLVYSKNSTNEGARNNVWKTLVESSNMADYVILMSDDDYLLPGFVQKIVDIIYKQSPEYLVSSYFTCKASLLASSHQPGLEEVILGLTPRMSSVSTIVNNRILSGTVINSSVIDRMTSSVSSAYYCEQWYVQFLACFADQFMRVNERLLVHEVENIIYWESFSNYDDMIVCRLKGYLYACKLSAKSKQFIDTLLLISIINFPLHIILRLIFSEDWIPLSTKVKVIIMKPLRPMLYRDIKTYCSYLYKFLCKMSVNKQFVRS